MRTRAILFTILIGLGILFIAGCSNNPAAGLTITPPPTLAPTASASELAAIPTATEEGTEEPESGTPEAGGTAEAPGGTATMVPYAPPNCGKSEQECTAPGPAIKQNLKGDAAKGQQVFVRYCQVCHGPQGQGGVANPGSDDGVVPALNPIDEMFQPNDPNAFATHIDAYVEHGSKTKGLEQMPAWGDQQLLQPQDIADVIAYVLSLNKQ